MESIVRAGSPPRRRVLAAGAGLCGALVLSRPADAQPAWPSRPVRLVSPFAPGGPTDILARMIAGKLSERLGQQVVVEVKAGAGGIIGTEAVARAEPDGYTLLIGTIGTHGINSAIYRKLPYDPVRDFAPITLVANVTNLLVVNQEVPARTLSELIALARARPGELTFGSAGVGSSQHLAGELLKSMAKIDLLHVPYKSGGQALPDVVGGKVSMIFVGIPAVGELVRAGKLRPLAVTTPQRAPAMPEVPTVAETLPGYEVGAWHGIMAPAGTPRPIVDRLNRELIAVMEDAEVRKRLDAMGTVPMRSTPEEYAAYVRRELDKFAKLVREANIPQE
jgi:tripartite-type tricarboxylate transporter receptor subunit TctC